jgi:hypothetical protein
VQVVAEFASDRRKILDEFNKVMMTVNTIYNDEEKDDNEQVEIYIMAHSEGTVIAFLGLLEAANQSELPENQWLKKVRGLMTFGSPIDKHLILWPELFPPHQDTEKRFMQKPIEWFNYYDRGDPIGFELDYAREWLPVNNWHGLFNFTGKNDFGFIRYPFPGEAHVEYWKDEDVFGHFIQTVVKPPPALDHTPPNPRFDKAPKDFIWYRTFSYVLPYVVIFILLFVAVFILFKSLSSLDSIVEDKSGDLFVFRNVLVTTILLAGVTVSCRIFRLTRTWFWIAVATIIYGIAAFIYFEFPPELEIEKWLFVRFPFIQNLLDVDIFNVLMATAVVVVVTLLHLKWPELGITPLLLFACAVIAFVVYAYVNDQNTVTNLDHESPPLWPVFIASAAFFYLWWLSALMFDLVFVWHVHIRNSLSLKHVKAMYRPELNKKYKA